MLDAVYSAAVAGSLALSGGGSGLISVPSAQLMPFNSFVYQHTDGFVSVEEDSALGRLLATTDRGLTDEIQFAVIPRVEFGARLTTWYDEATGQRTVNDLSGHVKLQLLDTPHFRLAVGSRDFSSESVRPKLSRAEFAVADFVYGPLQLTAGVGRADAEGVSLDGPFGGIRYSPLSWLDLLVDHDGVAGQAGVNLHASKGRYSVFLKAYATDNPAQSSAYALGFRLPLGDDSKLVPPRKPMVWGLKKEERLAGSGEARDGMLARGATDGLARTYGQNLAAGDSQRCGKELTYSSYSVPVLQLQCDETEYRVGWATGLSQDQELAPHAQLRLEPVQTYAVGTEVGRMDYSVALRPSLQAVLWQGLSAHVGFDVPVSDSDDYEEGGALARYAFESGLSEFAAQFTLHAFPGLFLQATGGQTRLSREDLQFVRGDIALMLFRGRLGLHYSYTDFDPEFTAVTEAQSIGKAFLWLQPARYAVQVTGGRFLYQDTGLRVDLYKYLGRLRLGLYMKDDSELRYVGMSVAVPLGDQAYGNRWVSLSGTPHYQARLETQVSSEDNANLIRPAFMREYSPQRNLLDDVLEQWRVSPLYVQSR